MTNDAADLAIITVTPTTSPRSLDTDELLAHLRRDTIPTAVAGTGVQALITGPTALVPTSRPSFKGGCRCSSERSSGCRSWSS